MHAESHTIDDVSPGHEAGPGGDLPRRLAGIGEMDTPFIKSICGHDAHGTRWLVSIASVIPSRPP
jgi:hypothetical protein